MGKGDQASHADHATLNEDDVIMINAAVPVELINPIIEGLASFYDRHSGVVFVSEIQVTHVVKFEDDSSTSIENTAK